MSTAAVKDEVAKLLARLEASAPPSIPSLPALVDVNEPREREDALSSLVTLASKLAAIKLTKSKPAPASRPPKQEPVVHERPKRLFD